jgi:hypothetical protein
MKFKADGRAKIWKLFEITTTIYSNIERSVQFLEACFYNFFLEVSQIWYIETIIIHIGKNNWDL